MYKQLYFHDYLVWHGLGIGSLHKQGEENNMKRLEVISLRASGNLDQEARESLRSLCLNFKKENKVKANFYVNAFIPGDLAIVISSQTEQGKKQKTDAAAMLADAMKHFGLVDYACWLTIED